MTGPLPPQGSYWVAPERFLAGCFPGSLNPGDRDARFRLLLDLGIRSFVNLMEADERNREGKLFADYAPTVAGLARDLGLEVRCARFPIPDLGVPAPEGMEEILDAVDRALERGPVYLHCWGGVGRTGTVAACWLLRHGHAGGSDALEHLRRLRRMDQVRGSRPSPETEVQVRFVREWARRCPPGRERPERTEGR